MVGPGVSTFYFTAGGAGKTPLTLWLAQQLKARGWRPGNGSPDSIRWCAAKTRS